MQNVDLMVGDLVTFKDCQNDEKPVIIKVMELHRYDDFILASIDGDKAYDELELNDEIVGIPLTPEILEKNGFERCVSSIVRSSIAAIPICNSNQFCCKDCERLRIIDRGIWHFSLITPVVCDTKQYEIHEIKYVHELQHALRLCGIDKEITVI